MYFTKCNRWNSYPTKIVYKVFGSIRIETKICGLLHNINFNYWESLEISWILGTKGKISDVGAAYQTTHIDQILNTIFLSTCNILNWCEAFMMAEIKFIYRIREKYLEDRQCFDHSEWYLPNNQSGSRDKTVTYTWIVGKLECGTNW